MNVVPRSTGNTNSGSRELTLKCKFKSYFKPMNNEAKKKSFDLGGNRANAQWVIHGFKGP